MDKEPKVIKTISEYDKELHERVLGIHTNNDGNKYLYRPNVKKFLYKRTNENDKATA